jgi:hypothetical protein
LDCKAFTSFSSQLEKVPSIVRMASLEEKERAFEDGMAAVQDMLIIRTELANALGKVGRPFIIRMLRTIPPNINVVMACADVGHKLCLSFAHYPWT